MIDVQHVHKYFGSFSALKDISFSINKGEIVGFLGQNGAGKTTLMRILTSYMRPSSGEVLIDGVNLRKNSLEARRKIGYLPETPPLYPQLSIEEYLKMAARLKDISGKKERAAIETALEECQLTHVCSKIIGTLSKGYKQRVGLAQAIIHDPAILILDEPTSGLDPVQNQQVRQLIKGLEKKRTVLLSTHLLTEIEQIAGRVLIIKEGEIITDQPLDTLMSEYQGSTLEDIFLKLHSVGGKA